MERAGRRELGTTEDEGELEDESEDEVYETDSDDEL